MEIVTLTFLFTDIERSTELWEQEPEGMKIALARHNALLSGAIEAFGGLVFKTWGDSYCSVFTQPSKAMHAALLAQIALCRETWPLTNGLRVRMAIHTGEVEAGVDDYYGPTLNRCGRLLGLARGGQVLVSSATETLVREHLPSRCMMRDLGEQKLKGLQQPERVYMLLHPEFPQEENMLQALRSSVPELPRQLTHMGKKAYRSVFDWMEKQIGSIHEDLGNVKRELSEIDLLNRPSEEASASSSAETPRSQPSTMQDCLRMLGLQEDVTIETVQQTYVQLMKRCDPERFPPDSEERARAVRLQTQIVQAYTLLKAWLAPELDA
jgi:class 3 adenylate cyclase